MCEYFGALLGRWGVPWAPSGAIAPGLVFRWILGGMFGPLSHPLGANGAQNATQIRKESVREGVLEEV